MTNINYEQHWFPYDVRTYEVERTPLILPPGKVFEVDIRYSLANWAWTNKITHAGVVAADESHGFEIRIRANPFSKTDWSYED